MAAEESPGLAPRQHRELFERFCRQKFRDGGRGCSKTVSSKKRDKIVRYLGNRLQADAVSPHFRFWVKSRGFQLVEMDGAQVLCLPNKHRVESDPNSVEWKRVATVEEFFDVIAAHHLLEDGSHLGIKKTLSKIVERYECLTRTAVEGYMEFCAGCRGRARKRTGRSLLLAPPTGTEDSNPLSFMTSAQVDLIDMNPNQDGQYQWLGHFTDHWSCFHILFPLTSTSPSEVAQNLCRHVFAVFGVPQILHCNLGRQFTTQVVQAMSLHWQGEVETEVGTQRVHNPVLDKATAKLEELIAEYLPQRPQWTQWLPSVQYTLNTELTTKPVITGCSRSPFNILFSSVTRRKSGEEEQEEEEEVEEEGEEGESEEGEEGGGEEVQLEVISDSITQDTPPAVWQVDVHPLPTCGLPSSTQPTPTANEVIPSAGSTAEEGIRENGGGGGGGGGKDGGEGEGGGGEDMSVQQILMPPDADFLSSFYEAAQLTDGNSRKRKRKQTPLRVVSATTPPKNTTTSSS